MKMQPAEFEVGILTFTNKSIAAPPNWLPRWLNFLIVRFLGLFLSFKHYAVYIGNGEIVHYNKLQRTDKPRVLREHISNYQRRCGKWVKEMTWENLAYPKIGPPEMIKERALQMCGKTGYSLLFHNCEHFAKWCVHGATMCKQVEKCILRIVWSVTFLFYVTFWCIIVLDPLNVAQRWGIFVSVVYTVVTLLFAIVFAFVVRTQLKEVNERVHREAIYESMKREQIGNEELENAVIGEKFEDEVIKSSYQLHFVYICMLVTHCPRKRFFLKYCAVSCFIILCLQTKVAASFFYRPDAICTPHLNC